MPSRVDERCIAIRLRRSKVMHGMSISLPVFFFLSYFLFRLLSEAGPVVLWWPSSQAAGRQGNSFAWPKSRPSAHLVFYLSIFHSFSSFPSSLVSRGIPRHRYIVHQNSKALYLKQ
ncbi:hypothetical protein LY76DRAFT_414872 [Colletotrichum caudatum]|nr:hypothetical protein LY76DRAFT_414872 [Colletotrichum caudatum]